MDTTPGKPYIFIDYFLTYGKSRGGDLNETIPEAFVNFSARFRPPPDYINPPKNFDTWSGINFGCLGQVSLLSVRILPPKNANFFNFYSVVSKNTRVRDGPVPYFCRSLKYTRVGSWPISSTHTHNQSKTW